MLNVESLNSLSPDLLSAKLNSNYLVELI